MVPTKQAAQKGKKKEEGGGKTVDKRKQVPKNGGGNDGMPKGKERHRPSEAALKELRNLQRSTELLIKKPTFARLVGQITRAVLAERGSTAISFRANAIIALQEAAEAHLTSMFEDGNMIAAQEKRSNLTPNDIKLARRLHGYGGASV